MDREHHELIDLTDDWRDDLAWRAEAEGLSSPGEYVEHLRRELADLAGQLAARREPHLVAAELRRLAASVEAMRAALPPLLATIPDAAEALGVSVSTVRRGIRDGSIPYRRLGRTVRVDLLRCRGVDADDIAQLARQARNGSR